MKNRSQKATCLGFILCAAAFAAAIWGSYYCGHELMQDGISPERAKELWNLIYFHFALSQCSLIIAAVLFYRKLTADKRYYLVVSYSEKALGIAPPGIHLPEGRTYFSALGSLAAHKLPPAGKPTLVFPMMMQSGYSSGERLEKEIADAYQQQSRGISQKLRLIMQPVLGASPWLVQLLADHLKPRMREGDALLLVAHNTASSQSPAPEPELFCRRLEKLFPDTEIALARFGEDARVEDKLSSMRSARVHIIPFLMSEGYHSQHDLPSKAEGEALGKELVTHPVIGTLMKNCD